MAKKSSIQKNEARKELSKRHRAKRARLKALSVDQSRPPEERMAAQMKLAEMPRNGAFTRVRNRCEITGRPRAYYRKLRMSRLALRDLASNGQIPGMVKSSW